MPHRVLSFSLVGLFAALLALPAAAAADKTVVQVAREGRQFNTLLAAAKRAGLVDALQAKGPITVFAPTDSAFEKLPDAELNRLLKPENRDELRRILTYHVVPGRLTARELRGQSTLDTLQGQRLGVQFMQGNVRVGNATVLQANLEADNGIVHVIDSVLLPTNETIVDIAAGDDRFSTLVSLVKSAGLADALKSDGPLTVFAPTNAAFERVPQPVLEALADPENKELLVSVLKYHVASGRFYADQAVAARNVTTLNGGSVPVSVENGRVTIGGATPLITDIEARNGVVHAIDRVLLPPDFELPARDPRTIAMRLISTAINEGVPRFNHGDQAACAAIYKVAALGLLTTDSEVLSDSDKRIIRKALRDARRESDAAEQAWILRDALDKTLATLEHHGSGQMTPARR